MAKRRRTMAVSRSRVPAVYYRAFKRRTNHRKRFPLAVLAGFIPLGGESFNIVRQNWPMAEKGKRLGQLWLNSITGYDPVERRFRFDILGIYGGSILAGLLVHKVLGKYINRYIPRGIPIEL